MKFTKVEIAGVKTVKDAIMSVNMGADGIGLLLGQTHESNDFIDKYRAKEIVNALPPFIASIMITHLENAEEIIDLAKYTNVNTIQLHSNIAESEVEKIVKALPYIKLMRLIHIATDGTILTDYTKFKYVDAYFFDSINVKTNQVGGTGLTHDWNTDKKLIEKLDKPVILAGGLNPDNVNLAVELTKPFGVDCNTGTKAENGLRDKEKVKYFTLNAKK